MKPFQDHFSAAVSQHCGNNLKGRKSIGLYIAKLQDAVEKRLRKTFPKARVRPSFYEGKLTVVGDASPREGDAFYCDLELNGEQFIITEEGRVNDRQA